MSPTKEKQTVSDCKNETSSALSMRSTISTRRRPLRREDITFFHGGLLP